MVWICRGTTDRFSALGGRAAVPAARISAIRFGKAQRGVAESWRDLLGREIKRDRLVILKGKTLDYLDGVVGEVNDKQIKFLLDGAHRETVLPGRP